MARMIDLSTLGIGERNPNAFNDPERAHGWNDLLKILEAAPTVDAVEVVRCKDCQKCLIDNSKMELHLCMKRPSFPVRVKLDGFCSDGERNDGDRDG